jgi:hypothetical protein
VLPDSEFQQVSRRRSVRWVLLKFLSLFKVEETFNEMLVGVRRDGVVRAYVELTSLWIRDLDVVISAKKRKRVSCSHEHHT